MAKKSTDSGASANKESHAEKIKRQIRGADARQCKKLIAQGFATKNDFSCRINQWMRSIVKKPERANNFNGLITKEEIKKWILETATHHQAKRLIEAKVITIKEIIQDADPRIGLKLIALGLIDEQEIKHRITSASLQSAIQLCTIGWATRKDFAAQKIKKWIQEADKQTASQLIFYGLATKENFATKKEEWIHEANLESARQLIASGLATKEDFAGKIKRWINRADPQNAQQLIACGLAEKSDFDDKMRQWIRDADPRIAKQLIALGWIPSRSFTAKVGNIQQNTDFGLMKTPQKQAETSKRSTSFESGLFLIDGTNVIRCWDKASGATLKNLLAITRHFDDNGVEYKVIFDASTPYALSDVERVQFEALLNSRPDRFIKVPAKTRADDFLLMRADGDPSAQIISNDTYSDYLLQFPWIKDSPRFIRGIVMDRHVFLRDGAGKLNIKIPMTFGEKQR